MLIRTTCIRMPTHKVMITYANPNRLSEILIEISPFCLLKKGKEKKPISMLAFPQHIPSLNLFLMFVFHCNATPKGRTFTLWKPVHCPGSFPKSFLSDVSGLAGHIIPLSKLVRLSCHGIQYNHRQNRDPTACEGTAHKMWR